MSTLKQQQANRLNSQKSTGPRTLQGKAVARFNALKTGIDADAEVIPCESPFQLDDLTRQYYHRWKPTLPEECALVDAAIHDDWQLRRLRRAEAALWQHLDHDYAIHDGRKTSSRLGASLERGASHFSRLQWRYDAIQRRLRRNLKLLHAMEQAAAEHAEAVDQLAQPAPPAEVAPGSLRASDNPPLPEPQAVSATPVVSTPQDGIGFVPEPCVEPGFPAPAAPLPIPFPVFETAASRLGI
jgi:hypothetical protein